jgi:hypothetical protein
MINISSSSTHAGAWTEEEPETFPLELQTYRNKGADEYCLSRHDVYTSSRSDEKSRWYCVPSTSYLPLKDEIINDVITCHRLSLLRTNKTLWVYPSLA